MKRLLTILLVLSIVFVYGQDAKPTGRTSLQAPNNVTWDYNSLDQTIGMSKGTYKWNKFFSAKKVQFLIDSLDIAKQDTITVTTTGTSGPSTLINGTLNIPQYSGSSSGAVAATTATTIGTAAKTATVSGYTLTTGDMIALTLTSGNSAAAMTLNINSTGAKNIRMNNVNTTTVFSTLAAGSVILLYYDGTYFQMMGSQRTTDTDTDNFDRTYWNNTITAGLAIYDYKILMQGTNGEFYPLTLETGTGTTKTVLTTELIIGSPILYYNSTTDVALNGTTTNVYSEFPLTNMTYTTNVASWTSQLPIYLKGTVLSNGNFKLDNTSATSWTTQTLPTTDDGFVYILLGQMYSTTAMRLMQYHPMYHYKDGAIRLYVPTHLHSEYVQLSPASAQSGFSNLTQYKLNSVDLFGSMTSGYLPNWDGTKFVNSSAYVTGAFNDRLTITSYEANGVAYIMESTNATGRKYGIGSNFVEGIGEFSIYDYTSSAERFRIKSNGDIRILNLAGTGDRQVSASSDGTLTPTDITTGTLSGTNVTWDYSVKKNYKITLTGNTVIALTNVPDGGSGTLYVTNAASTYTITFAGYINSIDPYIRLASNMVITSGGSKSDDFTFKYNGSKMNWNGTLDRH